MSEIRPLIVGTAGHIDHGKSSLVTALTGVEPDRLAEERERGMTIDLGFAPYTHASGTTVGIIDVPGHERFLRNMVAGATSVDVVLLVVAADDGVMPQTREHLAVLELLGVRRGVVALSKVDLVDAELAELAEADVRGFLADGCFAEAPVVRVSTQTGEGLDSLRTTLDRLLDEATPRTDEGPFRLPVQRVFSAKGHGLVAAGVPLSGRVAPGDTLEIVGSGQPLRVRAVQAYGEVRDAGRAGHSTALNLAGGELDDLSRGDVLASPDVFRSSRFLALQFRALDSFAGLRARHAVRLHVGTSEVLGHAVRLADASDDGHWPVQLRLDRPVCAAPGDRCVLRDASTLQLLGGGPILGLGEGRLKAFKPRVLADLAAREQALGDPLALALTELRAAGRRGRDVAELARDLGCPAGDLLPLLERALAEGELQREAERLFAAEALEELGDELVAWLKAEHRRQPLLEWLDLSALRSGVSVEESALRAAMRHDKRLEQSAGGRVRRRGHRVNLPPAVREARDRLLAELRSAGSRPRSLARELPGLDERTTRELLDTMRRAGEVVLVGGLLFHAESLELLRAALIRHGRAREGAIDIPVLRDELDTSRKFLIPLLEHWDAEGLTVRHGDSRRLRASALHDEPSAD
ncbi:MAG: selenocysteine-specific translation factor [Planctomycetota bacterium]|nr:MAG: selenocysteine-specific translation factor [Planctomycetota bacterium]